MNNSSFLDRVFHLAENGTTVKTEILAGITTFMTMAYILAVNPSILSATGMDQGALFTATALISFIGTLLMAFLANYPFALAPGLGSVGIIASMITNEGVSMPIAAGVNF